MSPATPSQSRRQWSSLKARRFGKRLRALRAEAGISQRELAFPGCTAAYISRVEKGDRYPSVVLIRELAERLNVTPEYLEFGDEAEHGISVSVSVAYLDGTAANWGVSLRWADLAPDQRALVLKDLDNALADTIAARMYAIEEGERS
jgi:transcriptional regulator with XRE-family HTH domain